MKFDMHIHTNYSDAVETPESMVRAAIKKGLNGIAITDHDNIKGGLKAKEYAKAIDKTFKVIVGAEVSSLKGHIVALGIKENVKPNMSVEETVKRIHDLGGIAVAAHPFQAISVKKGLGEDAAKTDAIEVFNAGNILSSLNKKSAEFARDYNMSVSAGSDSHTTLSVGDAGIICDGDPIDCIMKKNVEIFGKRTSYFVMGYATLLTLPKFLTLKRGLPSV
ncbi:MAG: PHP domain-containing protein [Candidatus Aenigmarchaeota archaeon]|nr:PHP domain-containing protein [Candidatus Aenigmarchaeota archaeon]